MTIRTPHLKRRLAVALLAAFPALSAHALGLGEAKVRSGLGQPLMVDVELLADAAEFSTMKLRLAPAADYQAQGLEFDPALLEAKVSVRRDAGGKPVVQLQTQGAIQAPYVQVILDGETLNGKVRRAYSLLINPQRAGTASTEAPRVAAPVAPFGPLVKGDGPAPAPAPAAPAQPQAQKPALPEASALTNIVQRGTAPARADVVKGYGRKQSMTHALFTIVPKGWKGFAADSSVRFAAPVDWEGNRDWLSALDGVLASAHLTAVVDWDHKEITFSGVDAQAKATPAAKPAGAAPQREALAEQLSGAQQQVKELEAQVERLTRARDNAQRWAQESAQAQAQAQAQAPAPAPAQPPADPAATAQLDASKARVAELEEQIARMSRASENSQRWSADKTSALQAELDAAKERAKELEDQVGRVTRAKENVERWAKERAQAPAVDTAVAAQLSEAKARVEQLEGQLDQLQDTQNQLLRVTRAKENAERWAAERTAEHDGRITALDAELKAAKAELAEAQRAIDVHRAQVAHMKTALESAQRRLSAYASGAGAGAGAVSHGPVTKVGGLRKIGDGELDRDVVNSAGLNVALQQALRQIVPVGWMVITDPSVPSAQVSWNGASQPWTKVLDELLAKHSLVATIDTTSREVLISR